MNKEKEYYNYLLKILSLTKSSEVLDDYSTYKKINKEIEKLSMEELNYFENVNFNKVNFFYKDYIPSNNLRILILIRKNDEYLFYKENNKYYSLNILNELYLSIEESIKKIEEKINSKILDLKYLGIYLNIPLDNKNNLLSSPEQVLIFQGKIDTINDSLIYSKEIFELSDQINKDTFVEIISKINKEEEK